MIRKPPPLSNLDHRLGSIQPIEEAGLRGKSSRKRVRFWLKIKKSLCFMSSSLRR
jgi:hypothetical protein